ncbi:MAG TPA: hypothetical protein VGR27_02200 [Longimicrobiaceae bacterium]|nr:hypothetical protein [Longimicrobiaceae bacterium]
MYATPALALSVLNFIFWSLTLAGILALLAFAWRSAMRRRGFRLVGLLQKEQVLRQAVDVPVRIGGAGGGPWPAWLARRGTLVLTRKRLAGFAHRARFVLVRGGGVRSDTIRTEGEWLIVRPQGNPARSRVREVAFWYAVEDAEGWARDALRVLRGR